MKVSRESLSPTKLKLTVIADQPALDDLKAIVLKRLSSNVKVPGFRAGKAPAELVEKQLDDSLVQSEFLNEAVNQLFEQAIKSEKLKVIAEPQIAISKFVPYAQLEFSAELEVLGEVKLPDYKKLKLVRPKAEVKAAEVNEVIENLRARASEKKVVGRAAKRGDQVTLDFKGTDPENKQAIDGASGQDYPLVIGSNTFIPGFEDQLVGLKSGDTKNFDITFPEQYAAPHLRNKKVNFEIILKKVEELKKPALDDKFASTVGPFKTVAELKSDIKKQTLSEKQRQIEQNFENEILETIADKTTVAIPEQLIEQEIDRLEEEEKRNLVYQGQTWPEHLKAEGVSDKEHHERQRPLAEKRIKIGIILGEIAEAEGITVTPEELEVRIMLLKNQYQDETMQSELDKPENRRDILNRLVIEKTLDKLRALTA